MPECPCLFYSRNTYMMVSGHMVLFASGSQEMRRRKRKTSQNVIRLYAQFAIAIIVPVFLTQWTFLVRFYPQRFCHCSSVTLLIYTNTLYVRFFREWNVSKVWNYHNAMMKDERLSLFFLYQLNFSERDSYFVTMHN